MQGLRVAWKKVGPYNYKCRAAAPQLAGASSFRAWHASLWFTRGTCNEVSHAKMASRCTVGSMAKEHCSIACNESVKHTVSTLIRAVRPDDPTGGPLCWPLLRVR